MEWISGKCLLKVIFKKYLVTFGNIVTVVADRNAEWAIVMVIDRSGLWVMSSVGSGGGWGLGVGGVGVGGLGMGAGGAATKYRGGWSWWCHDIE